MHSPYRTIRYILGIICCIILNLHNPDKVYAQISDTVSSSFQGHVENTISRPAQSIDSLKKTIDEVKKVLSDTTHLDRDSLLEIRRTLLQLQSKHLLLRKRLAASTSNLDNQHVLFQTLLELDALNEAVSMQLAQQKDGQNRGLQRRKIWEAPRNVPTDTLLKNARERLLTSIPRLSNTINWQNTLILLLITCSFFYWFHSTRKKVSIKRSPPIIQTCILFLILFPLFNASSAGIYIELALFLLLLILFYNFKAYVRIPSKAWWISTLLLFPLVCIIGRLTLGAGLWIRITLIALDLILLCFVFWTANVLKSTGISKVLVRFITLFYCIILVAAITFNMFGQLELSRVSSRTVIGGIVYLIGLIAGIKLVLESLDTWFSARKKRANRLISYVHKGRFLSLIRRVLIWASAGLFFFTTTLTLDVKREVAHFIHTILIIPIPIGSIKITLGNALYFMIIIYIAHWLQRNLDVLFSGVQGKRFDQSSNKNSTKITLLRLLIVIFGFLLGIAALGIPVDKLTIILGALSVGIGLGLQNIVNNFVSGIILIFEKPFDIGDFIELGDKKGRVQKIGIRSSTLLTQNGAEIIIPNGDLLSGRLVNWTLSTSYSKSEILIKVKPSVTQALLTEKVNQALYNNAFSIKEISPIILFNSAGNDYRAFIIQCWIVNIYQEAVFKSALIEQLINKFEEGEIIELLQNN